MFDLRSFCLNDIFRCSADLRAIGELARDVNDAPKRVVRYFFEHLRSPESGDPQCVLVRLFRMQALPRDAQAQVDPAARGAGSEAPARCLSLVASCGAKPEWNDPALSRRHRRIPLDATGASEMPMISRLIADLGVSRSSPSERARELAPIFDVFHIEEARGSPLVPDQSDFVEPYRVASALGFGGVVRQSELFIVVLFANVRITRATAELFRTLAPSVGLALLWPEMDTTALKASVRSYEVIVRHHEEVALHHHEELERSAKRIAATLSERQQFAAFVENSSDFIGIARPDGSVIYVGPAGRRMVGLSSDFDVTKTTMRDYYPPEARAQLVEDILPTLHAGKSWAGESLLRSWTNGPNIPVSNHHFLIREAGTGRVHAFGAILRDISEKRRADEERERLLACAQQARAAEHAASRAKDEFLAALGHELRNPLSPILTAVELMKLREGGSREAAIIERQALHLARLVDDLLDVARIGRGSLEVAKKPVEIATVVARAVEIVGPSLERRKQRLVVDVARDGLLVNADAGRLSQVVSNLLDNASKYSAPGSEIRLAAERDGACVRVRVRDQGIGIAPDALETIFESFVQQRRDGSRSPGLGLGLTIVRNLVGLHGGTVHAHSDGLGKGSELVVELPLLATSGSRPQPADDIASSKMVGDAHGQRVLVVDDNHDAAAMLSAALGELGHDVAVAEDGPTAIALAETFKPEVAFLDIGLPVMDGYELAQRLRRLPGMPPDLRLVAVSGFGQKQDLRRSSEAGFAAHLVKPVRLDALMTLVQRAA